MNFGVFVYHDAAFQSVADVTLPPLRDYCDRHGYSLTVQRGPFGRLGRVYGFQKTEMAERILPGYDALWVLDADVLITNHEKRAFDLMNEHYYFYISGDYNGINAGSYIAKRKCPIVNAALAFESLHREDGEQPAIRQACQVLPRRVSVLNQRALNSYLYAEYGIADHPGEWQPGDLCLHLPGRSNERRVELFTSPEITSQIIR